MKRFLLVALVAALVGVCAWGTVPTVTVTYTVADPSTTPPATAPTAYAVVTWSATATPGYLNTPTAPTYSATTGVLTWTLPQNCQVRFQIPKAYPAINAVYALGTGPTYSLNDLIPVTAPATAPAYMANYVLFSGSGSDLDLGVHKVTAKYFRSTGYPTASLPAGVAGDLSYDTTASNYTFHNGMAWGEWMPKSGGTFTGDIYVQGLKSLFFDYTYDPGGPGETIYSSSVNYGGLSFQQTGSGITIDSTNGLGWATGKGVGKVFTSDASGYGSWQTPTWLTAESDPRLPAASTSGNLLTSDGSAWTSATPVWGASATDATLTRSGSGTSAAPYTLGVTLGSRAKTVSVSGTLSTYTGQLRWYPPASIALLDVTASVGTAPTGADLVVTLKKNGSSIGTCTIAAGANLSSVTANTTALADTDYLTLDITQVGSTVAGADLTVRLRY